MKWKKKCRMCGAVQGYVYCSPECQAKYTSTVIVKENQCRFCGQRFPVRAQNNFTKKVVDNRIAPCYTGGV